MARISTGASYEASKRRYVANLDGEKIVLLKSVDRTPENDGLAAEMYEQEIAARKVQTTGDRSEIWTVLNAWLDWLANRPTNSLVGETIDRHQRNVQTFIDIHGSVIAREIRVSHIEDWLHRMQQPRLHPINKRVVKWEEGSVQLGLDTLRQAFKWANGRGLLTVNPFKGADAEALKNPSILYAGKRTAVEEHEHVALMKLAVKRSSKDFAILLMLLHATGARPGELTYAYAEEWDAENQAFVIRANEPSNRGRFKLMRLKKDRTVYVPDELVPLVELLMAKYKDAEKVPVNWRAIAKARGRGKPLPTPGRLVTPLFRKEKGRHSGQPLTVASFNSRIDSSSKKVNKDAGQEVVRPGVTPYSYRHGYVTRWLMAGKNPYILAELLGTSITMIERHYSHLFKKHSVLREHLNDFQEGGRKAVNLPSSGGQASAS